MWWYNFLNCFSYSVQLSFADKILLNDERYFSCRLRFYQFTQIFLLYVSQKFHMKFGNYRITSVFIHYFYERINTARFIGI